MFWKPFYEDDIQPRVSNLKYKCPPPLRVTYEQSSSNSMNSINSIRKRRYWNAGLWYACEWTHCSESETVKKKKKSGKKIYRPQLPCPPPPKIKLCAPSIKRRFSGQKKGWRCSLDGISKVYRYRHEPSLSTLHTCSLTTLAHDKPYHKKPLIRDCCNHKRSCTVFRPYQTIAAGISSSSFVRVSTRQLAASSLSKGISSTPNFQESNGTGGTRTSNLSHPSERGIDWANLTAKVL